MWFKNEPVHDWEKDFTESVRRVFGDETMSFEQSMRTMRAASGRQLIDFADRGRHWTHEDSRRIGQDRSRAMLKQSWHIPEQADLYLFFESCSRNGYIREQATHALRGYPGRLTCAAALLRCEDWVDQVAGAAARLLEDLAPTDAAAHLFDLLDLIVPMRSRQRFIARWTNTLEPILLAPRWREARRKALSHPTSAARLLAHELIARADPDLAMEALRIGMVDSSPRVAQFAVDRVQLLPVETRRTILRMGMNHALGSIRGAAMRRYRQQQFDDVRQVLIAALMDRNSSVRGAAAYTLEHEFEFAALPVWRAAFDTGRAVDMMTAALAESGDASDSDRLRSQLVNKRGRVRAAALQGLLRIGVADAPALVVQALRDPSSAVARAAARACVRSGEKLEDSALRAAFDAANSAHLRSRYISLSPLLSKWARLTFLLDLYRKTDLTEWPLIDRQVWNWIGKANRSYAQPGEERRQALARSLEDLRSLHPASWWDRLRHHL